VRSVYHIKLLPGAEETFADKMSLAGWRCASSFTLLSLPDVVLPKVITCLRGLSLGTSPPGITDCKSSVNAEAMGAASPPPT
jgi:hypothetical protein